MRTTRILPACGAGSVCAQLSGRDSLSVYCVLRARRLRHRRRIARGGQEQSATAARRHLDSGTAMGPVRRAPPTARLDALADGPATARSGRPYPRQSLGRRRPARGSISTAERPWDRCDELRRRPGSTRWPPGPRRRGPEGRTRARASEGAGRLASSQVLQHVPRRSLSRRMRSRARRGTRREIHRYRWTGLGRRGALYIFV